MMMKTLIKFVTCFIQNISFIKVVVSHLLCK